MSFGNVGIVASARVVIQAIEIKIDFIELVEKEILTVNVALTFSHDFLIDTNKAGVVVTICRCVAKVNVFPAIFPLLVSVTVVVCVFLSTRMDGRRGDAKEGERDSELHFLFSCSKCTFFWL